MKFNDFYASLESLAPKSGSAVWDNDGVMVKPPVTDEVKKVLVALDPTADAIRRAAEGKFDVLLTHHPLIFKGMKRLTGEDTVSNRVLTALAENVAVVSLHTRLDAAVGGVNDVLLALTGAHPAGTFGDEDDPTLGRLGELDSPVSVRDFALKLKVKLGCDSIRVYGDGEVKKVAVLGGSGKDFIIPALVSGADVFVTGEVGYNTAESAAEAGLCIIEAGHYHTEVPVCERMAEYVRSLGIEAEVFAASPYRDL